MKAEQVEAMLVKQFDKGPLACDNTHTMFWNVLTLAERKLLAEFVAAAIEQAVSEARLDEVSFLRVEDYRHHNTFEPDNCNCIFCKREAVLRAKAAERKP
jgi:hypothetical protein